MTAEITHGKDGESDRVIVIDAHGWWCSDWLRGVVCGRVRIRGVVYGLRETAGFAPFAVYRIIVGITVLVWASSLAVRIEIKRKLGSYVPPYGLSSHAKMAPPLPFTSFTASAVATSFRP